MFTPFQFSLELLLDFDGIKRRNGIGDRPANHDRLFRRSDHFRYFVHACSRPHGTDRNTILQPEVLWPGSAQRGQKVNHNVTQETVKLLTVKHLNKNFYRTMHCSAKCGLAIACLSVCLSVTLVDQDHIGWKSWKLIAQTLSPTPSLFVAQRPSTYSRGNLWKFWGD